MLFFANVNKIFQNPNYLHKNLIIFETAENTPTGPSEGCLSPKIGDRGGGKPYADAP